MDTWLLFGDGLNYYRGVWIFWYIRWFPIIFRKPDHLTTFEAFEIDLKGWPGGHFWLISAHFNWTLYISNTAEPTTEQYTAEHCQLHDFWKGATNLLHTTVYYPCTAAACPRLATVCCCISAYALEKSFTLQLHVPSYPQYAVVCISVYTLEKSFALQLLAPI